MRRKHQPFPVQPAEIATLIVAQVCVDVLHYLFPLMVDAIAATF